MVGKSMIQEGEVVQHLSPVWQKKADFVIMARIEDGLPRKWEQLWAKQLGPNTFEICCIPFAVYNLNLADHVRTDDKHILEEVIKPSGRSTFRVWFGNEESEQERENLRELVLHRVKDGLGCLVEWYSRDLLAIDTENHPLAQEAAEFLKDLAQRREIVFEAGSSSSPLP